MTRSSASCFRLKACGPIALQSQAAPGSCALKHRSEGGREERLSRCRPGLGVDRNMGDDSHCLQKWRFEGDREEIKRTVKLIVSLNQRRCRGLL